MPKKKIKMSKKAIANNIQTKESFFKKIKLSESYISLALGIIVVIIAAIFVVSIAKNVHKDTSKTKETASQKTQESNTDKKYYTVNSGDDLWSISEKMYKSGYNWVDIANANNLENPGMLFAGDKLKIPNVEVKKVSSTTNSKEVVIKETPLSPTPTQDILATSTTAEKEKSISGNSYTVQEGEYLWDIAVRAYGDGYKWTDIAIANNITNPDFIFKNDVLKLPR